jgi:hypothetical protein
MAAPIHSTNPPSFKVFVETNRRLGGPSGRLVVYTTALALYPSASCQRLNHLPNELHQTTPKVSWVSQPFFPPWLNRAIDFRPDDIEKTIRLRPTGSARRSLRGILEAAGFEVADVTSRSVLFGP